MENGFLAMAKDKDVSSLVRRLFNERGTQIPLSDFRNALVEQFKFEPFQFLDPEKPANKFGCTDRRVLEVCRESGDNIYPVKDGIVYLQ